MMLPSRLDCPLSLKTPNMGNPGLDSSLRSATFRMTECQHYLTSMDCNSWILPPSRISVEKIRPKTPLIHFRATKICPIPVKSSGRSRIKRVLLMIYSVPIPRHRWNILLVCLSHYLPFKSRKARITNTIASRINQSSGALLRLAEGARSGVTVCRLSVAKYGVMSPGCLATVNAADPRRNCGRRNARLQAIWRLLKTIVCRPLCCDFRIYLVLVLYYDASTHSFTTDITHHFSKVKQRPHSVTVQSP